jgi:hypothetical protein
VVLSPELLDAARQAAKGLDSADRQAMLARGEYHTAVRRLHLAGASLREIAQALSLSHQRVQQIVSGAGGSWWSRVWRSRNAPPDAVCTWCSRPPSEVARLIAGPNVFICDACVGAAEGARSGRPDPGPFDQLPKRSVSARCAFCGKRAHGTRSLVTSRSGHICTECLTVCREILDGSEAQPASSLQPRLPADARKCGGGSRPTPSPRPAPR